MCFIIIYKLKLKKQNNVNLFKTVCILNEKFV